MSSFVIFDTWIFLDHLRTNRHRQQIEAASCSDFELIRAHREFVLEIW